MRGTAPVSFKRTVIATFDEPWAAAFAPGTKWLFVTEKPGTIKAIDTDSGRVIAVGGAPHVDYGGQGGLGDIAFLPWQVSDRLGTRRIYLSWAEAGDGDTRGAVVGLGRLVCDEQPRCAVQDLKVIWRQQPKVTGRGHYSHRIAFDPDRQHMFIASGERQKGSPAQDTGNNLGSIVRVDLEGRPASGNPFARHRGKAQDIWSWGHRNILGLKFDAQGRLWALEHGPAGGDELNLIERGRNYGWPIVSNGDDYDGRPIPDHATRPEFASPAISWTPVIAPGDFIFYSGPLFPQLDGEAVIAGLRSQALIRVRIAGDTAQEIARYPMDKRLREIVQGPEGAIWLLEDGSDARLWRLTPG